MKRFARCTCLILAIAMILTIPAFATEAVEPKGSRYFGNSSVYLCNVSGTSFEAWFDVTCVNIMDVVGVNYIKIQRSSDGSNWTTVKTYTKENYPNLVRSNHVVHTAGVSYTAVGGYYYRAFVQLYAQKGVNTATMNAYSSPKFIPAS